MPVPSPLSDAGTSRARRRRRLAGASLAVVATLAACSDNKKPAATASSGSTASSFSSAPLSTTTTAPARSLSSASPSTARSTKPTKPPVVVTCDVFDLVALNSATGHTWTAAGKRNGAGCAFTADNGNGVNVDVDPQNGQSDAAYTASQSRCDSGTIENVAVGDGAYVCVSEGMAVGAVLIRSVDGVGLLSPSGFGTDSPTDVENALRAVLQAFRPPGG